MASHYFIQAGAFQTKQTAEQLKRRINRSFSNRVFIVYEKHHYLVRIGPFEDRKRVQNIQTQLAKKGIHGSFSLLA